MFGIGLIIGIVVGLLINEVTHIHQCEECVVDSQHTHCIDCDYYDEVDGCCHHPCGLCTAHDFSYCSYGRDSDGKK